MQPAELCARLALLGTPACALPLVITKHNLNPFCRLPGERFLGRWVARRAGGIIAVSDSLKALCDRNGCTAAAGRTTTIHNAIDASVYENADPNAVAAARKEWGSDAEDHIIGTAARLLPLKAIDILIRGFADYLAHAKLRAKLVVAGAGPIEMELKSLAASLRLGERVVFAGFREDMSTVMNAFDVFALTSNTEGFGMVVLEAMASGKPVIATNVGGIPELINNGIDGILIEPRQPAAVAQALTSLEDGPLRARLGAAGRRKVRTLHGQETMYRRTMEFYEKCIE